MCAVHPPSPHLLIYNGCDMCTKYMHVRISNQAFSRQWRQGEGRTTRARIMWGLLLWRWPRYWATYTESYIWKSNVHSTHCPTVVRGG